ncbi:HNH endonuclease [Mycoplasma sp. VS31B]
MSKEWNELREKHLTAHPFCSICQTTFRLQVDHIIEHGNDLSYFLNEKNLRTLCIRCHSRKTRRTQQLRLLRNDMSKKIRLVFNSPRGLEVSSSYFFTQSFTSYYQVGNVIFFYFSKDFNNYTIQEIELICNFLCDFFCFIGWRTNNIDNEVICRNIKTKMLENSK